MKKIKNKNKKGSCLALTSSTKREIRQFHVVVEQRRRGNVQKSVMHVQSCCFACLNLLLFCRSRGRRRPRCLSSLLIAGMQGCYFHYTYTFLSFNYNIHTDTSVCKVCNGTMVRLVTKRKKVNKVH